MILKVLVLITTLFFTLAPTFAMSEEVVDGTDQPILDWEWKKSEALEQILNQKLQRIVTGAGITDSRFSSNVIVLFDRKLAPPEPKEKKEPAPNRNIASPKETLEFPELQANPMDLDTLIKKFRADSIFDQSMFNGSQDEAKKDSELAKAMKKYRYIVSLVNMEVSLDESIPADRSKALEDYIHASFAPAFGTRLVVQVKPTQLIPAKQPTFFERLEKFQKLALALIFSALVVLMALLLKLIPTRRSAHQMKLELDRKMQELAPPVVDEEETEEETEDEEEPKVEEVPLPLEPVPALSTGPDMNSEISRLEGQIAEIVKQNPSLSRLLVQDFLSNDINSAGSEQSMVGLALLLETLSKFKVSGERFNVKADVLRKFQAIRSKLSTIGIKERLSTLEEVYWSLVSFSFFTEGESSFPLFHFLEPLEDGQVSRLLASETPEIQAMILLGMNEKKSARILQRLNPNLRQAVFEIICSGNNPAPDAVRSLVDRIRQKSAVLLQAQSMPASSEDGVATISMLLTNLDFRFQFETVKGLFVNAPELRRQLKGQVFFAALLPEAKSEFLGKLFIDRTTEWLQSVIAPFGEQFRDVILDTLPPMQRRMLESVRLDDVSVAASFKALSDLQKEIQGKIASKEISLDEIFNLDASAEGQRENPSPFAAA